MTSTVDRDTVRRYVRGELPEGEAARLDAALGEDATLGELMAEVAEEELLLRAVFDPALAAGLLDEPGVQLQPTEIPGLSADELLARSHDPDAAYTGARGGEGGGLLARAWAWLRQPRVMAPALALAGAAVALVVVLPPGEGGPGTDPEVVAAAPLYRAAFIEQMSSPDGPRVQTAEEKFRAPNTVGLDLSAVPATDDPLQAHVFTGPVGAPLAPRAEAAELQSGGHVAVRFDVGPDEPLGSWALVVLVGPAASAATPAELAAYAADDSAKLDGWRRTVEEFEVQALDIGG